MVIFLLETSQCFSITSGSSSRLLEDLTLVYFPTQQAFQQFDIYYIPAIFKVKEIKQDSWTRYWQNTSQLDKYQLKLSFSSVEESLMTSVVFGLWCIQPLGYSPLIFYGQLHDDPLELWASKLIDVCMQLWLNFRAWKC